MNKESNNQKKAERPTLPFGFVVAVIGKLHARENHAFEIFNKISKTNTRNHGTG